jgi:hypothetical protein
MNKVLAATMAGLIAAGAGLFSVSASAQGPSTSQEAAPPTNTKPQQRAQERRADKPQGEVRPQGGDTPQTAESSGVATGKSAAAGQARADTRSDRRRDKHGNVRKMNPQGGTPQ